MTEQWRDVPGWEGLYAVSNKGRVASLPRWVSDMWGPSHRRVGDRILTAHPNHSGHYMVALCGMPPGRRTMSVHRLVLLAFVGPCPDGLVACHYDGDPANNVVANLRWDTVASNVQDSLRHGTNFQASKVRCVRGHAFDQENTYIYTSTGGRKCRKCRQCRQCAADYMRVYRQLPHQQSAKRGTFTCPICGEQRHASSRARHAQMHEQVSS